jgi:hypothetical protein
MKITKENYNELKKKELDNNFAKVWHVNEIREELLANTPEAGGVTSVEGLVGDVTFQNSETDSPNIRVDIEGNSLILNYVVPYQEVNLRVESEEALAYMYHSTIPNLFYNVDFTGTTEYPDSIRLTPNVVFECSQLVIQMTMNQQYGGPNYVETPYVISTNLNDGSFRIGIKRDDGSNGILFTNGLKSSVNINIKIFGYIPPQP